VHFCESNFPPQQTIFEYATRVGQQAVVLVATPGKPNNIYKVFGAKPLEDVIKNLRTMVMDELESALAQQAPPKVQEDPSLFELPPLIIDGIPTPVEKMTQAQLRAFIPLMLKYSTGKCREQSIDYLCQFNYRDDENRTRQTRLGQGLDATRVVAEGASMGECPHGRANGGRKAED
jgi:hypothetical protein